MYIFAVTTIDEWQRCLLTAMLKPKNRKGVFQMRRDTKVKLGMTPEEVVEIFGAPDSITEKDYNLWC